MQVSERDDPEQALMDYWWLYRQSPTQVRFFKLRLGPNGLPPYSDCPFALMMTNYVVSARDSPRVKSVQE
jgi:hypothetical protein